MNDLKTDACRKGVRSLLHCMVEKAVDDDILMKNPTKNTSWTVTHDPRVLKVPMTYPQEKLFVQHLYAPRVKQAKLEHVELISPKKVLKLLYS